MVSLATALLAKGLGQATAPAAKTFWSDQDGGLGVAPNIFRMRDRVFVGNATLLKDSFGNAPTANTWASSSTVAPTYPLYCAQMAVMHERGGTAITGYSRMSDKGTQTGLTGIGVAGVVIADHAASKAWAGYFEVQFEQGVSGYCLELDAKNKSGVNVSVNPYSFPNGGTYGAWVAAGGDSTQGGAPTNPSAAAIVITQNTHTWNTGIVVRAGSLTGSDGTTGAATAIDLPRGHMIRWRGPTGVGAATINSSITNANKQIGISFQEDALYVVGNEGTPIAIITRTAAGAPANYPQFTAMTTGVAPQVTAAGSDINIDLYLRTKGTGVLQFGTHAAIATETVTGYVTIKDAGGIVRKLAVVS